MESTPAAKETLGRELAVHELAALPPGLLFAPTAWIAIEQARIDAFAGCTDDRQFIHVDPARARATPFGGTIAHGFLALALLAGHPPPDFPRLTDLALALNYGLDRVRFVTPVPAGARVRLHTQVVESRQRGAGRVLLTQEKTMEIEGVAKPAFTARQLTLFVARDSA